MRTLKRDNRGAILIEVMVAAVIFAVVSMAIAFYFVFHLGTVNDGRAQLKLQRTGSLVLGEIVQAIRRGRITDLVEEGTTYSDVMITYPDATTRCYRFENSDIAVGPDCDNLTPLEALDDSLTLGSLVRTHRVLCDDLRFVRDGDTVIIRFTLRHDLDNSDGGDDLVINFGSTVKMRG
jgi:hypothetical protein